jgi:hypothetical protein
MQGFLDKLPAWLRHALIAFFGSAVTVLAGGIAAAVSSDAGIAGIQWATLVADAANAGLVAAIAVLGVGFSTTITQQYGYKGSVAVPDVAQDVYPPA